MIPFYFSYKQFSDPQNGLLGVVDVKKSRTGKYYARISTEPTQWVWHEDLTEIYFQNNDWNGFALVPLISFLLEYVINEDAAIYEHLPIWTPSWIRKAYPEEPESVLELTDPEKVNLEEFNRWLKDVAHLRFGI